ncbi:MAG: hypothetical protein AAGF46_10270 [Pseudomonadota bacterium]
MARTAGARHSTAYDNAYASLYAAMCAQVLPEIATAAHKVWMDSEIALRTVYANLEAAQSAWIACVSR